ncbi:DUF397 domain-containing protein [Paractinoplanes brasiliensis]|uniref:Uncharacterized protein DUF397 n=1 Tax=Paractinoplanes brasiliensis TaxID=52695 RepID=A0A4R6J709_9ACTN|nr:DUF397 domain-containing protein [Actinoplanes brasiliensis]TDO31242.1 uncharacterized protein DUF397 [Actinoplanes brasiliensis]GID28439.1 hypothetical protein Abr02nite_34220 [Actinoplanes brasiliensis]
MSSRDLSSAVWRKSTRSGSNGGDCVEVATNLSDVVPVRDTKDRDGGTLMFTPQAWAEFIAGVKVGEFDI